MTLLRQIEKTLDQRLRAAFGGGQNGHEAIELYRELLEEVSHRTTPGPRGVPVFPFNQIRIFLRAENAERRAVLETIFARGQLMNDVRACLQESRASVSDDLAIEIVFNAGQTEEMRLAFERAETPESISESPAARIPLRLVTLAGVSSEPNYSLNSDSLHIGRGPDVVDAGGRTVRRNELFFADDAQPAEAATINNTVSRAHAHLLLDQPSAGWRIYDDGSSFGTSVFRSGRRIDVPAHGSRGVGLQPGDEIWLGNARLRLEAMDLPAPDSSN